MWSEIQTEIFKKHSLNLNKKDLEASNDGMLNEGRITEEN